MTMPEEQKLGVDLEFSVEVLTISGNRKLYVYRFDDEQIRNPQEAPAGNISMEGTNIDD